MLLLCSSDEQVVGLQPNGDPNGKQPAHFTPMEVDVIPAPMHAQLC